MTKLLLVALLIAVVCAGTAGAHERGHYWSKAEAEGFFETTPLRPYGAYDGLTIRFAAVSCNGLVRQLGRESSPPTIHQPSRTIYKHFYCAGITRNLRAWDWFAHGHKFKMTVSYLECQEEFSKRPCP